ncbi:hypothetical protein FOL47_009012, partial [Perkinsus chesapeaki]
DTVDGCSWWVDDWMEKWSAGVRKEALDRLRRREELREEGLSRSATPSVGSGTDPPSYRRPLVQQVLPFQRSKFHSLLPPELIRRSNRVADSGPRRVDAGNLCIPVLEGYRQQQQEDEGRQYYDQSAVFSDQCSSEPMAGDDEISEILSTMEVTDASDPVAVRRVFRKIRKQLKRDARMQRENTEDELRSANADMDAMRNDIAYLQEDLDQKLALEKKLLSERNGSKQKEAEMMKLVKKVYGDDPAEVYNSLLNTNEELQNEMDAVIDERNDLSQQVDKLQQQLDDLRSEAQQKAAGNSGDDQKEDSGAKSDPRMSELLAEKKQLETENADLKEELQKRRDADGGGSPEGPNGVIQTLAQENVELKQQIKSREVELAGLRADLKDLQEERDGASPQQVNEEVEELRKELRELQHQHDELWTHLNKALEEKWNMEEQLRSLGGQHAAFSDSQEPKADGTSATDGTLHDLEPRSIASTNHEMPDSRTSTQSNSVKEGDRQLDVPAVAGVVTPTTVHSPTVEAAKDTDAAAQSDSSSAMAKSIL